MRTLIAASIAAAVLTVGMAGAPVLAAADPTVSQIYEAASSGRLDEAQLMMNQVLRDHPTSAKAHFVQAELYAREGKIALARAELNQAEQLKPGLPDEKPRAVEELKAQLGMGPGASAERALGAHPAPAARFPWGSVLVLALVVGVFWMLFRRRRSYAQYPAAGGAPGYGPGGYGPQGYGPGAYPGPAAGGIGSNIAGGLAGGLAAGAGIVAGEELAHHFLDGGHGQGVVPAANAGELDPASNADMGGNNFGVNDPGSWDDGGGGDFGGGGGDDWS